MAAYPSTLPRIIAEGYSLQPLNQVLRTDMDSGPARQRRRSTARIDQVPCSTICTDAQLAIFRAWFEDPAQAAGGAAWFTIKLAVGQGGLTSVEARFTDTWRAEHLGGLVWKLSFALEVR